MFIKKSTLTIAGLSFLAMVSCKKEDKNFSTISGKITNKNSDSIVLLNKENEYKKVLKVDNNGNFKDTIHINDGFFTLFDGKEYANLYLKKGKDINLSLDTKQFDETISFTGNGALESSFLAKSNIEQESFFSNSELFELPKEQFDIKLEAFINSFNSRLADKNLDSNFVNIQKEEVNNLRIYLSEMYNDKIYLKTVLAPGKPAPKFIDYENFKGNKTSLDDFKGKYIYIDVWATWCQPCKQEQPFLNELEKEFSGKNIEFVSISIDDEKEYEIWKNMIIEKQLGGTHLFSKKDQKLMDSYKISGIPRFIVIDPEGNIVNSNAPRPSQKVKVSELLNSLKL